MDYRARAEGAAECLRLRSIVPMTAGPRLRMAEPGYDEDGHPLATPTSGDEAALWQAVQALHAHNHELAAQVRGLVAAKDSQGRRRDARIEETTPARPTSNLPHLPAL